MSKLLIVGAGAEKAEGIDMPLANELVPQIRDFLNDTDVGREVEKCLRKTLKGLRFHYDDFVRKAVDKLASEFKREVNVILSQVKEVKETKELSERDQNIAQLVINFLSQIQKLQEDVILDEDTADLIREVFNDVQVSDENIVDLGKLSFSDTFEIVMKRILEISIQDPNNEVLKHVYRNLMDFENLLLKHFIGFYNNSTSDIRNYLYISWTLWAFLVWKEKEVWQKYGDDVPFYSTFSSELNVITFNYTSFANQAFSNPKYFHGSLNRYIRLDNRGECEIDDYQNIDIVDFIEEIVSGNIDFKNERFIIPSIIPPLRLKPVLSNKYIDIWHESVKLIRDADKIVIVGYSFNYADEHFNDLIRKNKNTEIFIVDPFIENVMNNIKRVFNLLPEDYTKAKVQTRDAYVNEKLTLIKAKAEEINVEELLK